MSLPRFRHRLDTLLILAVFVAIASGGLRTWQTGLAHRLSASERLARSLLDARSAALDRPGASTGDLLFPAVIASTAFAVPLLLRKHVHSRPMASPDGTH